MKCLYIYNPISGSGKADKHRKYIVRKLTERFGEVDVYATQAAGELSDKAREACGKYDVLVFAGGDGSFNEVVNGLGECENRPVLGYIPTGTVNDIARSTGIKRSVRGAVANIVNGGAYPLDVMKVNDRYVMYVACSGGMTGCSYNAEQSAKKKIGKFAYALEVIKNDLVFDKYPVSLEGEGEKVKADTLIVMIMNGRSVASFPLNRNGKLDDGKVEIVVVHEQPPRWETEVHKHLRRFFGVIRVFLRGFRRVGKRRDVNTYEGDKFSVVVPDSVVWNFDGEKGPSGKIDVSVLPKHVSLIIPRPGKRGNSCLVDGAMSVETVFGKSDRE